MSALSSSPREPSRIPCQKPHGPEEGGYSTGPGPLPPQAPTFGMPCYLTGLLLPTGTQCFLWKSRRLSTHTAPPAPTLCLPGLGSVWDTEMSQAPAPFSKAHKQKRLPGQSVPGLKLPAPEDKGADLPSPLLLPVHPCLVTPSLTLPPSPLVLGHSRACWRPSL